MDLLSEGREAKAILQRMIKATPRLAVMLYPERPELHPPGMAADQTAGLVAALNRGFGRE
ncbi:MAG: hypothetical protein ABI629_10460 [bacterium]